MERMGDILAKNATRRVSQRRPPSEPTPAAAQPASAPKPANAPRQPSQSSPPSPPPARAQRTTMPPTLSRRVAPGRPRPALRPPSGAASVSPARPAVARSQPDTAPAAPATSPTVPAADVLDSDRILELPRRAALIRRTGAVSQDTEPQRPGAPAPSSSRSPTPPDAVAEAVSVRGARVAPRRLAVTPAMPMPPTRAMSPLRELAQDYVARRPTTGKASSRGGPSSPAGATTPRPVPVDPDVCPICHGAGFMRLDVPVGDPSFGQAVPCSCKERQLEERHQSELRRLSSLDPFMDKTFATFDAFLPGVHEAYEAARRYADDPQGWLVLMGGYGVGKTHLAAAIAHQRLDAGSPVFFSIVPDLLDHLRAAFAPSAELRYDDMFDRIREAGLLILDDLGAENGTAWATEKLFQLINYRYNFRIPTVITTNHRLLSHMDERIRSRLSDLSLVRHVTIEAGDYRDRHAGRAPRGNGSSARSPGPPRTRGFSR